MKHLQEHRRQAHELRAQKSGSRPPAAAQSSGLTRLASAGRTRGWERGACWVCVPGSLAPHISTSVRQTGQQQRCWPRQLHPRAARRAVEHRAPQTRHDADRTSERTGSPLTPRALTLSFVQMCKRVTTFLISSDRPGHSPARPRCVHTHTPCRTSLLSSGAGPPASGTRKCYTARAPGHITAAAPLSFCTPGHTPQGLCIPEGGLVYSSLPGAGRTETREAPAGPAGRP